MNGAHLHLLVNHVSLFALLIGAITLAIAMNRKSSELRVMATTLFVIAGIFGWIAYETGEKAEEVVKALGEDMHSLIEQHEQAAVWALRSCILVASLALATEWATSTQKKWAKALQWVLLLFAIHGCTVFSATAWLGGQIRHTELRDSSNPN